MVVYKIIVGCVRQDRMHYESWFHHGGTQGDAIREVKERWHVANDCRFVTAKDAEFFIKVE